MPRFRYDRPVPRGVLLPPWGRTGVRRVAWHSPRTTMRHLATLRRPALAIRSFRHVGESGGPLLGLVRFVRFAWIDIQNKTVSWYGMFGNYDELPVGKEEMCKRLSELLGRSVWKEGTPFTSTIPLRERRVSRKPIRFEKDLESAFKEIVAEVKEKSTPSEYL